MEAEKENVDDRCESDISGIATDDSDLSSMSCGAGITMETGNVVYRHQPDPVFNTLLTCCTVLMLCFAIGIGVGHYFGQSLLSTTLIDQVTLCCTASLKRESLEITSPLGIVMPKGLCFADVPFYFNSSLGDQLSQNVLTDLHQIFRIGTHMGGRDHSDLLFPITQWTLLW